MLSEAQRFWETLEGKVKSVVDRLTKNTFRCERYTVTTAPNGTKIGVTLPMGTKEIFLPYSEEVAHVSVGTPVLVVWWGSMSNAKVCFLADGYDGVDVAFKVFDSVSDIGLTVGSATISGAFAALRNQAPALLICPSSNFYLSTEIPGANQYGVVEIAVPYSSNSTARGWINFYSFGSSLGDYRMYLASGSVPTNVWVEGRNEINSVIKTYDSVEDLGLNVGSATISGAVTALSNNAPTLLFCNSSDFGSNEVPNQYGEIEILSLASNRVFIRFYGQTAAVGDYRMYLSDGSPSGTWEKTIRSGDLVVEEQSGTTGSISAGSNKSGSITITKSGYTPIAIAGFNTGNTWLVVTQMYISSSTTLNYTVRNVHASSNASGTVSVNILYVKN